MSAIGEQMIFGTVAHNFREALAEFASEKTHYFADTLQGETFAPEFADHCDFGEVMHGIHAAMTLALGLDDSTLVPPLELARGDPREVNHFVRCKTVLHSSPVMFETNWQ